MIRGLYQLDGRTVMFLGIDAENLRRLKTNEPIFVDGVGYGMGAPADVFLAYHEKPEDRAAAQALALSVGALAAEQKRPGRGLLVIILGLDEEAALVSGQVATFQLPQYPMDVDIAYGETTADVVRLCESAGLDFPVTPAAVAAHPTTPGNPLVVDLRRPKGSA